MGGGHRVLRAVVARPHAEGPVVLGSDTSTDGRLDPLAESRGGEGTRASIPEA